MNKIITKIEIDSFRSIRKATFEVGNTNVFSGLNDVGKSNILRALNLFFNGQTDFGVGFNFNTDYSKISLASAQKSAKKKQQVKIKIYFNAPTSFKSLTEKELWIEKVFDRLGTPSEHSSLDDTKQKASLTRLLNNIQYFYIPALKGSDVMQYILGEVGKRQLIAESDIQELNEKVNKSIIDLAKILTQSSIQTETKFELPVLVEDFWQKLNINTKYDEFVKLDTEINPSKKGNSDPLKEEFFQVPLQLRGEGVKSKFIPPLLQWIQNREPNKQYIWGIDEPENSLEFKKAQEVANLYFSEYSKSTQLFLTSHSLAFIFPDEKLQANVFRCIKGSFGETEISLLKSLFTKQEKLNLAEEIGALEIQKEMINEWRLKDKQIQELNEKVSSITKPVIFVEGEFDEIYFNKSLEVFDKASTYPADIKWIGHKKVNGEAEFTGKENMEKAEKFLRSKAPNKKTVLFYDVDCGKQISTSSNLTVYCPEKITGTIYESGTEHLIVFPSGFDKSSFSINEKKGDIEKSRPDKKKILDYVLALRAEKQKECLTTIDTILEQIKTNYL